MLIQLTKFAPEFNIQILDKDDYHDTLQIHPWKIYFDEISGTSLT